MLYSHSRLSSFEDCPKKFEYRYLLKIPSDSESIEGFVGKRVHEVLERLYIAVDRGNVPSLDKVLIRYNALFDEAYDAERVRIVREGTPLEFYRRNGERCLANYYRSHYPFDGDETLGLEQRVTFALDADNEYHVQGIIDRIVRARDGAIEIHDYKTGRRVPRQQQLDTDRQLALYQIGVAREFGNQRPIRLVWHYVLHNRTCTSTRTPEQLESLKLDTIGVIDRIQAETEWRPKKGPLCGWCEYRDRCPLFAETADRAPGDAPELPAAVGPPPASQRPAAVTSRARAVRPRESRPEPPSGDEQLSLL